MDEETNEPIEELEEETNPEDEELLDELDAEEEDLDEYYGDYDTREGKGRFGEKEFLNRDRYKEEAEKLKERRKAALERMNDDYKDEDDDFYDNADQEEPEEKDNSAESEETDATDDSTKKEKDENDNHQEDNPSDGKKDNPTRDGRQQNNNIQDQQNNQNNNGKKKGKGGKKKNQEEENATNNNQNNNTNNQNSNNAKDSKEKKNEKKDEKDDKSKRVAKTESDKAKDKEELNVVDKALSKTKVGKIKSGVFAARHPIEALKYFIESKNRVALAALTKNPYFWLVMLIILLVIFVIFMVIMIAAANNASIELAKVRSSMIQSRGCNNISDGSLMTFLGTFETNNPAQCTTADSNAGYLAIDIHDGTISIGQGMTNYALAGDFTTNYINKKGWGKFFRKNESGRYYISVGDCVPQYVMDELTLANIEDNYGATVSQVAENLEVTLYQHQKDALTSFYYNTGTGLETLITAYKNNGYSGLWEAMKGWVNRGTEFENGLKARRKAEFALFVTGDYSDQGKFYNRDVSNYDDYNSEGIMERELMCGESAPGIDGLATIDGYMARTSRPLRTNSIYYAQDEYNYGHSNYEGECSWYARYRAEEILKDYGLWNSKPWTSAPNGGEYCSASEVTSGKFKTSNYYKDAKPGALISWVHGMYGHVAVVEAVKDEGISISEAGLGFGPYRTRGYDRQNPNSSSYIYNHINNKAARKEYCEENGTGCFHYNALIPWDNVSSYSGSFVCYIYLLDEGK